AQSAELREVRQLIAEGMAKRALPQLARLLEHADMRVRQDAQFELVERKAVETLVQAVQRPGKIVKLHGIWGLGMLARQDRKYANALANLLPLAASAEQEVRCQALKVLGEARYQPALQAITDQLKADQPRVRFHAALAIAKLGQPEALPAIL